MNPKEILEKAIQLQKTKGEDYTSSPYSNQFENFEKSAIIISWFTNPTDQIFAALIGTKLARLSALLSNNKTPNNESIEDTFVDAANYFSLWGGMRSRGVIRNDSKTIDDFKTLIRINEFKTLIRSGFKTLCCVCIKPIKDENDCATTNQEDGQILFHHNHCHPASKSGCAAPF